MLQEGWLLKPLFSGLLFQPASSWLGFPSGMYWWEIGGWEEGKSLGISSPRVSCISGWSLVSSAAPGSWFQLQPGNLGSWVPCFVLLVKGHSNLLPLLTSGAHQVSCVSFSFATFHLLLNSSHFRHLDLFSRLAPEWYIHTRRLNFINGQTALFSKM